MASFLAKNTNIGLIMLPQAFGPFTSLEIKKAFSFIATRAKLIYARDKESYNHLTELVEQKNNIRKAPDFTNLTDGIFDSKYTSKKDGICIIPNNQMVAKTDTKTGELYVSFLKKILKECLLQNEKPFILIHGSGKDVQLAEKITSGFSKIDIIIEENPLVAKGLIGISKVLISSRYHGIINGLSQGVPTFGTGWSHKYKEVFNDYNFNEGLLPLSYTNTEIKNLVGYFKDTFKLKNLQNLLIEGSIIQKKLTENMWDEVFAVLKGMKG
jgi:colanic acid/amylovoran biosynthesis protein